LDKAFDTTLYFDVSYSFGPFGQPSGSVYKTV